jgi:radical SAM superfamily enzyme YgiQ (UPF0313 family)
MKTVVVYNPGRFEQEIWLPALWCQAKTYYERHGQRRDEWRWASCIADVYGNDFEKIKLILGHTEPDVFAVSLYVWNYAMGHRVAEWVKRRWPNCLVITGGPQQNFRHNDNWFQQHPWIDVSLPGECYGELFLTEVLDHIQDDGSIDFDQLTDACYPQGRTRFPTYSPKRSSIATKKQFQYDFTSFADQELEIRQFVNYCQSQIPKFDLFAILETTRGCPYGCTYCDWGGGISTAVLQKSVNTVTKDLEFLCQLQLKYLYIADANFGIFGDRDVEIMRNLVECRHRNNNSMKLGYGGWAKTQNKLPYIQKLITMDIENDLSNSKEIKISMQSLDSEILKNIDRKNIDLDLQLEFLKPLSNDNRMPLYVELILGLPGMTLDKFYHEISVLGQRNLSIMWFEWLLLPETPAYAPDYRKRFGLKTVHKRNGWSWPETDADREVVVETASYTRDDYLTMLLSAGLYNGVVQGGMYHRSIQWILKNQNQDLGKVLRCIIEQLGQDPELYQQWNPLLDDATQPMTVNIADHLVYVLWYWVAKSYFYPTEFQTSMQKILVDYYGCPQNIFDTDSDQLITVDNFGRTQRQGIWKLDYRSNRADQAGWPLLLQNFLGYKNSGSAMLAQKKFLF